MLVPTVRTSFTNKDFAKSLIYSWQKLYNTTPSKQSICIILAQHQLETGGNNCWNYNTANIKYTAANGNVDYCSLKGVWEMVNGVRVELKPTDPGSWFRSFPTLDAGAEFYLQFISGNRYKSAWQAVVNGDVVNFVHLLKMHGYFTADESTYLKGVEYNYNADMKQTFYEDALAELNPTSFIEPTQSDEQKVAQDVSNDPAPINEPVSTTPQSANSSISIFTGIFNTIKSLFSK